MNLRSQIIVNSTSYEDAQAICEKLHIAYDPRKYDPLTLTWEDIAYLNTKDIVTIGNHTHSHPIFNNLSCQEVLADITKAQHLFKAHNITSTHFCYPFGGRIEVDKAYFHLPESLGFKTALTTRFGHIYNAHSKHLFALPRIMMYEHFMLESSFKIRKKLIVTH